MGVERYSFEYPDEAGYPDGTGFLSEDQKTLIDQVTDAGQDSSDIPFSVVEDTAAGAYRAVTGDTAVGEITFTTDGDRVTLVSTRVLDEFTQHGVATELIRRVLDLIADQGRTVTIRCPIVRTFIDRNPQYEALVDTTRPGVRVVAG